MDSNEKTVIRKPCGAGDDGWCSFENPIHLLTWKIPPAIPAFRVDSLVDWSGVHDLKITHNYYDHKDADSDINIVFPVDRLREFVR